MVPTVAALTIALLFFSLSNALRDRQPQDTSSILPTASRPISTKPFGIRVAFFAADHVATPEVTGLTITWSTSAPITQKPCCEVTYSTPSSSLATTTRQFCGTTRQFIEPSTSKSTLFHHSVDISYHAAAAAAIEDRPSSYRCGSAHDSWSDTKQISLPFLSPSSNSVKFLLVGDLGVLTSLTLPNLIADASTNEYSALLHVGDLAYDLHSLDGRRATQFLDLMEPITSFLPYMVTPGNHEAGKYNFTHYRQFYTMPDAASYENLFYSYTIGPVHVVSYNTEVFFWPEFYDQSHMQRMFDWMDRDLAQAHSKRDIVPWILVVGHRPMYCAAAAASTGRCGWEQEASRKGIPSTCPRNNPHLCHDIAQRMTMEGISGGGSSSRRSSNNNRSNSMNSAATGVIQTAWPIEELFHKYGVDIAVYGHIHDYERYAAVYNYTSATTSGNSNGDASYVYTDPKATVHVTSGAGGNSEMKTGSVPPPRGSCKFPCLFQSGYGPRQPQSYDFSHSRIVVYNSTHLYWEQVSATSGSVVDSWWVIQHHHGGWE